MIVFVFLTRKNATSFFFKEHTRFQNMKNFILFYFQKIYHLRFITDNRYSLEQEAQKTQRSLQFFWEVQKFGRSGKFERSLSQPTIATS